MKGAREETKKIIVVVITGEDNDTSSAKEASRISGFHRGTPIFEQLDRRFARVRSRLWATNYAPFAEYCDLEEASSLSTGLHCEETKRRTEKETFSKS